MESLFTPFHFKEDVNSLAALGYENDPSKQDREAARREVGEREEAKPVNWWFAVGPCSQMPSLRGNKITFDCSPALPRGKLEPSDI